LKDSVSVKIVVVVAPQLRYSSGSASKEGAEMNALLNYPQTHPTWEVLQLQYGQVLRIPVPGMIVPQPLQQAQPKSPVPALVTIGSALLYALSDNEVVKTLALQGVSIGGAVWINQASN
jgi:hypothetical protein